MKNLAFIALASSFLAGAIFLSSPARAQDAPPPSFQFGSGASFSYAEGGGLSAGASLCLHEGTDAWEACIVGAYDFGDFDGFGFGVSGGYNEENYLWGVSIVLGYSSAEADDLAIEAEALLGSIGGYLNMIGIASEQPESVRHIRLGPAIAIGYERDEYQVDIVEVDTDSGNTFFRRVMLDGDAIVFRGGISLEYDLHVANGGIWTFGFYPRYTHAEVDVEGLDIDSGSFAVSLGIDIRY